MGWDYQWKAWKLQKLFMWSMRSYPADVTAPFSLSNGSFSIKAARFFSRFSTAKIKRKDHCWVNWWTVLKQRTRECLLCGNYVCLYKKMQLIIKNTKSQRNVALLFQHNAWFVFLTIVAKVMPAKCGDLYPLPSKFFFISTVKTPLRIPA